MISLALLALAQAAPLAPVARPQPCFREEVHGTTRVNVYLGDRICVDLDQPRVFEGVWLNDFEGSRFVDGARSLDDARSDRSKVWLNRHDLLKPSTIAFGPYGRAYRIRFVGRAAKDGNRKPLEGYGHFGMSQGLVVVDELLALDDIGSTSDVHGRR